MDINFLLKNIVLGADFCRGRRNIITLCQIKQLCNSAAVKLYSSVKNNQNI